MLRWLRSLFSRSPRGAGSAAQAVAPRAAAGQAAQHAPSGEGFAPVLAELVASAPAAIDDDSAAAARIIAMRVMDDLAAAPPELVTLPGFATRVIDALRRPNIDANHIVQVVQQDPALAAKVLSVANSALLRRGEVRTIREAVVHLGDHQIGNIAMAVAARTLFAPRGRAVARLLRGARQRLYTEALTVAFTAGSLADLIRVGRSDHAFLGGMLIDLGKAAALDAVIGLALAGDIAAEPDEDLVFAVLESVGPAIAGQLAAAWHLPDYLAALCDETDVAGTSEEPVVAAVRLVAGIATLRARRPLAPAAMARTVAAATSVRADGRLARIVLRQLEDNEQRVAALFPLAEA